MDEDRNEKREGQGSTRWVTLIGLAGALLVVLVTALVFIVQEQPEPEKLYPAPANITFSGVPLNAAAPNPVAVRLRNFIAACAVGDTAEAARLIDPDSRLADNVTAACGTVLAALAPTGVTGYRIDRVAAEADRSTVYITALQPGRTGERYTFFLRKAKGEWLFSVP